MNIDELTYKPITKQELLNKIAEITKLAVYITSETDADVFIDYSGHVDDFEITIYPDGWRRGGFIVNCDYKNSTYIYNQGNLKFDGDYTKGNIYRYSERGIDITMRCLDEMRSKLIELASEKGLDIEFLITEVSND